MIQSTSAANAKKYFNEALAQTDYFLNDQELSGRFQGKLSAFLNTGITVTKEAFHRFCDNLHPFTGATLTQRSRDYRTVGYDIVFSCPKSVSILNALAKDNHIQNAFTQSVSAIMQDIEADALTRVRKNGKDEDRQTSKLIWAEFVHLTARPVKDAFPDPFLHCHCFTFNATHDDVEQQYKAVQFRDIKRDMPYYQAKFYKTLADNLVLLGYQIRHTPKSFEIVGVPEPVLHLFSKRKNEIELIAKQENITNAKELDGLGARTRAKKQKRLSMEFLKQDWKNQILALGLNDTDTGNQAIRFANVPKALPRKAEHCIDHAMKHCFERASVVHDRRLLAQAYLHGMGNLGATTEQIADCFTNDARFIKVKDGSRLLCTTQEVIEEEKRMVGIARLGKGAVVPLYAECPELVATDQAGEAIRHVLTTSNRISIIKGGAGTGKTTLMQEAVKHIEFIGKKVTVVAPTAQASCGVLRDEGFTEAETVATLLSSPALQDQLTDGVLWVDEAGLLGGKDMIALLDLVTAKNARLILGGDTRQHASVMRMDALRILNTIAGIPTAEVSRIYRQRKEDYRLAVHALSQQNIKEGFEQLQAIGAIKPIDRENPYDGLVNDYYAALKKKKAALVICPTHYQGELLTAEIRKKLRKEKKIGTDDFSALRLVNINMTEAEKADWHNYQINQLIQFNQNVPGIKRGSAWQVKKIENEYIHIQDNDGNHQQLPLAKSKSFEVYRQSDIALAKGDTVQITRNGFDKNKKRLNNGQTLKMIGVKKDGSIHFRNTASKTNYYLPPDYGHLAYAHCVTSYASQGKTVDEVFVFQPEASFPATNAKQFYVSVSRAREFAHIYTEDHEALLFNVSETGDRLSALELIGSTKTAQGREEQITRVAMQGNAPAQSTRKAEQQPKRINELTPIL